MTGPARHPFFACIFRTWFRKLFFALSHFAFRRLPIAIAVWRCVDVYSEFVVSLVEFNDENVHRDNIFIVFYIAYFHNSVVWFSHGVAKMAVSCCGKLLSWKWLRILVDVRLARGLRIRVKTIGGFLRFIRQVGHCVFHCAVHFCQYCTHLSA